MGESDRGCWESLSLSGEVSCERTHMKQGWDYHGMPEVGFSAQH